jgi:hypothetical protein
MYATAAMKAGPMTAANRKRPPGGTKVRLT